MALRTRYSTLLWLAESNATDAFAERLATADVRERDNAYHRSTGFRPTHWAAYHGNIRLFDEAATAFNPYYRDNGGKAPLVWSVVMGQTSMANHLIETYQATVNQADEVGLYPIHWAAFPNSGVELFDRLVAAGARPDVTDTGGRTPLDWAVLHEHERLIDHLVALGFRPSAAQQLRYALWADKRNREKNKRA